MASTLFYQHTVPHAFIDAGMQPQNAGFYSAYLSSPPSAAHKLKRKRSLSHSTETSDGESSRSSSPPAQSTKRRRLGTIERGFEDLAIVPPPRRGPSVQPEPVVEEPDDDSGHPYSYYGELEEYTPVETSHDVHMRNSSWYEPEKDRIIVTDLDASSDEEADDQSENLHISPAVLEALRRSRAAQLKSVGVPTSGPQSGDGTGTMVLYRRMPWNAAPYPQLAEPTIEVLEDDDAHESVGLADAMDVDMMDVEEL